MNMRINFPRAALVLLAVLHALVPVVLSLAAGSPLLGFGSLAISAGLFLLAFRPGTAEQVAAAQIMFWLIPLAAQISGAWSLAGPWAAWTGFSLITFLVGLVVTLMGTTWFDYRSYCQPTNDFSFRPLD